MTLTFPSLYPRGGTILRALGLFSLVAVLAACTAPAANGINDPFEAENRQVHQMNVALDRNVIKPVAMTLGKPGGGPVQQGISNFADNLDLPGIVANDLLQLRLGKAVENTLRFGVNTVVGIGGLLDPARAIGLAGKPTDFGETLHVWGVAEGEYMELPFYGPSTRRDTMGLAVDYAMNPLRLIVPKPQLYVNTVAQLAAKLGDRARYSETVDSILYGSADSYAQARLLYLQNRRYQLGQTPDDAPFVDPYEDPYGQ